MPIEPPRGLQALALCACLAALASSAGQAQPARPVAQPSSGGTAWSSLSPIQREALAPLQDEWPKLDADRRSKWLAIATRYPGMSPDDRRRMQERMAEWARLSPAVRGRARLSFQEAKRLPPQERQARWEAYQALPEDQRKALAGAPPPAPSASARPAASSPGARSPGKPNVGMSKPVAPTLVQANPGATTRLMTLQPAPPPHQVPGQPHIAAAPSAVDRKTLLPKSGPQGAAAAVPAAAASAPRKP